MRARGCQSQPWDHGYGWTRPDITDAPGHVASFAYQPPEAAETISLQDVWTVARHLYFTEDESHRIIEDLRRSGGERLEP
ncbi:MAG: hypothetical protein ACYTGZ_09290 [Planctomycetota bacterium]